MFQDATCAEVVHQYSGGEFGIIHLTVTFKRLSKFYVQNLILPNAVLLSLCTLTFFIPGEIGEKVSFGVTLTLALCVNLMIVTDFVPETSKTFPKICTYFLLSIVFSCISIVIATLSINFKGHRPIGKKYEIAQPMNAEENQTAPNFFNSDETKKRIFGKKMINFLTIIAKVLTRKKIDMILGALYFVATSIFTFSFIYSIKNWFPRNL